MKFKPVMVSVYLHCFLSFFVQAIAAIIFVRLFYRIDELSFVREFFLSRDEEQQVILHVGSILLFFILFRLVLFLAASIFDFLVCATCPKCGDRTKYQNRGQRRRHGYRGKSTPVFFYCKKCEHKEFTGWKSSN